MTVFVDTSALYAVLDEEDESHQRVAQALRDLDAALLTHNYVVAESAAVVERRLGKPRARDLLTHLLAPIEIVWIDESTHDVATSAYLAASLRGPSLVDLASFEVMRAFGIRTALAVDRDFAAAGFELIP